MPLENKGFTLVEVMIAMLIMVISFTSILSVEHGSIDASEKARDLTVVAMLAKNKMVETELELEGKTFSEIKEEEDGDFEAPYQNYKWKREIKEIEFPDITGALGGEQETREAEIMGKLVSNHLSKSLREVTITVTWPKGPGFKDFKLSTYWVNLENEFAITQ